MSASALNNPAEKQSHIDADSKMKSEIIRKDQIYTMLLRLVTKRPTWKTVDLAKYQHVYLPAPFLPADQPFHLVE